MTIMPGLPPDRPAPDCRAAQDAPMSPSPWWPVAGPWSPRCGHLAVLPSMAGMAGSAFADDLDVVADDQRRGLPHAGPVW